MSWTFGTDGKYTASWDGSTLTVTVTTGGAFVASFAGQSLDAALAAATAVPVLSGVAGSASELARLGGIGLVATTGADGHALADSTGNILTWTAPDDGALHRALVIATLVVGSTETGGKITYTYTAGGAAQSGVQLFAAAASASSSVSPGFAVDPGTAVTVDQGTPLSGGAAVLYAEIWAL